MIETQDTDKSSRITTKLFINNLPHEIGFQELIESVRKYGKIKNGFLSKPKNPQHENAGWAVIEVTEEVARQILSATIVIRDRIIQVRRAWGG